MVKTENRGGKREGSGRKRLSISDQEVTLLIRSAKRKQKETGESVADQLIKAIYNEKGRIRVSAIKVFYDQVVSAVSESDVSVSKTDRPAIYLPEKKADPANVVPIKKAGNG